MILFLYLVMVIVSWFYCAGMLYSNMSAFCKDIGAPFGREDLGFSLAMGFVLGFLGPLGLFVCFLITGFAKNGVWKTW